MHLRGNNDLILCFNIWIQDHVTFWKLVDCQKVDPISSFSLFFDIYGPSENSQLIDH